MLGRWTVSFIILHIIVGIYWHRLLLNYIYIDGSLESPMKWNFKHGDAHNKEKQKSPEQKKKWENRAHSKNWIFVTSLRMTSCVVWQYRICVSKYGTLLFPIRTWPWPWPRSNFHHDLLRSTHSSFDAYWHKAHDAGKINVVPLLIKELLWKLFL